ncbi:MAG TPA: HAD-IA family hydrolase, partial [Acidimicrobiales bacterium]|nr:HAD-IA family hydrolase [Acidimicrobiales bacterium]
DVYLEAERRLDVPSHHCVAVEDATNGIRSAVAAGMPTVVIPNRLYPPAASAVDRAQLVLASLDELTVDALEHLDAAFHERADRRLDEQEVDSFPASDPHSDWAGPPG